MGEGQLQFIVLVGSIHQISEYLAVHFRLIERKYVMVNFLAAGDEHPEFIGNGSTGSDVKPVIHQVFRIFAHFLVEIQKFRHPELRCIERIGPGGPFAQEPGHSL